MKVVYRRCAGLDVHKDEVVACARVAVKRTAAHELQRFPTTVAGLMELAAWLTRLKVRHVAMEATGVYWKPVWHVLEEEGLELVLANAQRVRNVPGRKSDVNDAAWIADLLAHGLIAASFVPPQPIRELRDLTRTRRQLVRERGQHANRIAKVLEDANIKLSSVLSDLIGMSGRRILKAMIAGETDPERLAGLASRRLASSRAELVAALAGRPSPHHRFLIAQHLTLVEQLETRIAAFDHAIATLLAPFRDVVERMKRVPGLNGPVAAPAVLAEIGTDMSRFPTAGHLVSWARLVPRLDESAGQKRSTRIKRGGFWLKPLLVQCAFAAARKNNCYLQARFRRLAARRGAKKAAIAVAAAILTALYHMLRDGTAYREPDADFLRRRDREQVAQRLARRIRQLGYAVDIRAAA